MNLDLHYLKTFYHLCLTQSYTETARKLHVTQSAVSHTIKKLETISSVKLIEKNKNRFALTEYGELVFQTCEGVFTAITQTEEILGHKQFNRKISIDVGAPIEFGNTILIDSIQPFLARHPRYTINIKLHHELFGKLLKNEVDFIIDCKPHYDPSTESVFLCDEAYSIVCTPEYAGAYRLKEPNNLSNATILSLDERGAWWENFFDAVPDKIHINLNRIMTINHIRGLINAALNGMGVAMVPRYTVLEALAAGTLLELFTDVAIREDKFQVFIKTEKRKMEKNRLLIDYFQSYFSFCHLRRTGSAAYQ